MPQMSMFVEHLGKGNKWYWQDGIKPPPQSEKLYGLLVMGYRDKGFPFSFGERGLPPNATDATKTAFKATHGKHPSYLFREELQNKATELLLHQHPDMGHLVLKLKELISNLPEPPDSGLRHQRIVFWFRL